MDYEKKHKEEIDRATQLWECGDITRENLEYIFPELKENKDEKTRESLKSLVLNTTKECTTIFGISQKDMLAWIEKQGEQKSAWSEEDETALQDALWCIEQARKQAKDENDMGNIWYAEKWLKSLKDRFVIPKEDKVICVNENGIVPKKEPEGTLKQLLDEYSVDDLEMENLMMAVDDFLEEHPEHIEEFKSNYIKRFGDTTINQWKPSEWQLKKLYYAMHNFGGETFKVLNSLYNDLKKL